VTGVEPTYLLFQETCTWYITVHVKNMELKTSFHRPCQDVNPYFGRGKTFRQAFNCTHFPFPARAAHVPTSFFNRAQMHIVSCVISAFANTVPRRLQACNVSANNAAAIFRVHEFTSGLVNFCGPRQHGDSWFWTPLGPMIKCLTLEKIWRPLHSSRCKH
jgi:hypothetical protein